MGHRSSAGGLIALTFFLWAIAAWFTHVIVTIQNEQWLLLIAGAILAPIGVIHGTGLWFGAW
jgi:hypothetical protein